jgi:hypothetical protein
MPNHCTNRLTLSCGSKETAQQLAQRFKGEESELDFNQLIPCPEELLEPPENEAAKVELKAKYGHDNWYDWRIAHWGTKWNSYECELDDSWIDDGILEYQFDTAWSPPEGIHNRLLELLQEEGLDVAVSWFYHEPMMQYAGYF